MSKISLFLILLSLAVFATTQRVAGQNLLKHSVKTYATGLTIKGTYIDDRFFILDPLYLGHLKRNFLPIKDTSGIYYSQATNKALHYYSLAPTGKVKGVVVLLPASGEQTEDVINANKTLLGLFYSNNVLAIILSINNDNGLDDDPLALKIMNTAFIDVSMRFKVSKSKFILGGLSNGGMLSLRYLELSRDGSGKTSISPLAAYAADPPVDIADLYNTSVRQLGKYNGNSKSDPGKNINLEEAKFLIDYYTKLTGGSPVTKPEEYRKRSMYDRNSIDGGNAKYLINVPIKIYCDPDINWQIKYRNRNFYDMNAADLSSFITYLRLNGNTNAEFISSIGLGRRLDGTRNPHSWSIVKPKDCMAWVNKLLSK